MKCEYYKNIRNSRVLIASPLPKPYGGIAIHAQRLKFELEMQNNEVFVHQAHLYKSKIQRLFLLIQLMVLYKPTILVSHTSYHGVIESLLFILFRLLWFKKWILVEHDCRYLHTRSGFFKKIHRIACRIADDVVLMGNAVKDLYDKYDIKPCNYVIDNPYIPPNLDEIKLFGEMPKELDGFLNTHQKTILINGSCFMEDDENRDIYGFDTAIRLLSQIQISDSSIGLIIMLGSNNDQAYFLYLQEQIQQNNLTNHVLWLIGNYYLPTIVSRVSVMIRPTISENFGISIAEAIDLGIPVVASDCCSRYPGALIYPTENFEAFQALTVVALEKFCS